MQNTKPKRMNKQQRIEADRQRRTDKLIAYWKAYIEDTTNSKKSRADRLEKAWDFMHELWMIQSLVFHTCPASVDKWIDVDYVENIFDSRRITEFQEWCNHELEKELDADIAKVNGK